MSTKKRQRGVVLTPTGLHKLKEARYKSEQKNNLGSRYTYEKLSEITSLDVNTVIKVLKCKEGVDQRTLERFFRGFNLELTSQDQNKPHLVKCQDLREAICVDNFQGRTVELMQLEQWLLKDRCRVLSILGIGGVGKTALSVKLTEMIGDKFDRVVWKSLKHAPSIDRFLTDLIQFLSGKPPADIDLPKSIGDKITKLIDYLRSWRCLLVFDSLESVFCSHTHAGVCRQGYEGYEELFQRIGETNHKSSLLIASREKPNPIAALEGEQLPVKTFRLNGLKEHEGNDILKTKGLIGSESALNQIVKLCYGNVLAIKMVATTIKDVFAGNVAEFLAREMVIFGDIYQLLDEQFERLSVQEQEVVYWLAVHQEPIKFSQLLHKIELTISVPNLIEVLESLSRRSMIESQKSHFTLLPIFREYIQCRFARTENVLIDDPQIYANGCGKITT